MAVTRETRDIWRTSHDPEFEGESEAETLARDRMLAARAFVTADVQSNRRFRDPAAEAREVDLLLDFLGRYELHRLQPERPTTVVEVDTAEVDLDIGGYGGTEADDDAPPATPLVPGESIHNGGDSYP